VNKYLKITQQFRYNISDVSYIF